MIRNGLLFDIESEADTVEPGIVILVLQRIQKHGRVEVQRSTEYALFVEENFVWLSFLVVPIVQKEAYLFDILGFQNELLLLSFCFHSGPLLKINLFINSDPEISVVSSIIHNQVDFLWGWIPLMRPKKIHDSPTSFSSKELKHAKVQQKPQKP